MMTPPPALLHGGVERARHVDVAEHLQIPRLPPALVVDLVKAASRDGAGVVDQDIDVGMLGGEFVN